MILIRHGESIWNAHFKATRSDPDIRDAPLTAAGRLQAAQAAEKLCGSEVRGIITSPYTRALQTSEIIASVLKLPARVEPLIAERALFSCDVGSPRSQLARRWPRFDFGHLDEEWWSPLQETEGSLLGRCAAFRSAMAGVADWRHLLVISHWAFIRGLTGHDTRNGELVRFDPTAQPPAARGDGPG